VCVARNDKGVGDEDCFLLQPFMQVTNRHGRGAEGGGVGGGGGGGGGGGVWCCRLPEARHWTAVPRPAAAKASHRVMAGSCLVVLGQALEAATLRCLEEGPACCGGWPSLMSVGFQVS
jgi:hypothetical protein